LVGEGSGREGKWGEEGIKMMALKVLSWSGARKQNEV